MAEGIPTEYEEVLKLVTKAQRVLVTGHVSPDGDALGSMLAMAYFMRRLGKEAYAAADLKALGKPGVVLASGVREMLNVHRLKRRRFDLLVCVDCAAMDRIPQEIRPFAEKLPIVCIDHHLTNRAFGNASVIDPSTASTTQLIWRFAKAVGWEIDDDIAKALWVGLVTDSGRFQYQSTSQETLMAAADIVSHGVPTAEINDTIFGNFSMKSIELKKRAWRSLHIWKNRKVCEVSLTREDFRAVRGTKADIEDAVEIPRSVARNEIALYFYEILDRKREVKVSIRTRGDWDATVLAQRFGGGGHKRAAGCTIKGAMNVAKRQMRKAVKELMQG